MKIPVYQWDTGELQEREIPLPTVGNALAKGDVYRLVNGIIAERFDTPAMNLKEFMGIYPDSICKQIITNIIPAVYQFESPEHSVAIYLLYAPSSGEECSEGE